jgi:hypothetical protein
MNCRRAGQGVLLAFALLLAAGESMAQANPNAVVSFVFRATDPVTGYDETTSMTCRGLPTCTGPYTTIVREDFCPNFLSFGGQGVLSGLQFGPSSVTGTITLTPGFYSINRPQGGPCTLGQPQQSENNSFTLSWNPSTGTGSGAVFGGTVTFKADITAPPPPFPMVVSAQINAQTATASADIQFRPQDVGTQGSVFVFAVAPASLVGGGLAAAKAAQVGIASGPKAGESCVLAQRNSSGQLVALTAAQLSASISGTLSAAGASVTILNGVSTPTVAGATFYVGYGSGGASMLNNGIFRNAVTVPGTGVCPMLPFQTALWWNPSESGWGLNLNQQGGTVFGTLFAYDSGRAPMWLVMSNGVLQPDGLSYTGDLYRTTGPAFNANPFTPIGAANVTRVGAMTVSFADAGVGTLQYSVDGVSVTKAIQRQVYGSRAATCLPTTDSRAVLVNYQDLWWNPAESGWGLNLTHQDNTLFGTLFTYDAGGRGLWLVMPSGARQGDGSYLGDLYRTAGPPFSTVPFTPIGGGDITNVGTMRLRFSDGNNGTLTYTYNGTQVVKSITRQVFSSPVSLCN